MIARYAPGVPGRVIRLTAADFDRDELVDLAVPHPGNTGGLDVLLNHGAGVFVDRTNYPVGPSAFVAYAADLNGDGRMDVVEAGQDCDLSILLGRCTQ